MSGMLENQYGKTLPPDNSYRILLRRLSKSLNSEEVNDLCYISHEVHSSGIQNKTNFNGTVLFKFFEQRMLIIDGNLDYLRELLQSIERMDLCKLIDDYMSTYLNGPFSSYSEPLEQSFAQSHLQASYGKPQSLHVYREPQKQSLSYYMEPRPRSSCMESQAQPCAPPLQFSKYIC